MVWIAWLGRTLTPSGSLAAWTIGCSILYGTGWSGGAVLAAFFVSSSLISRAASSDSHPETDAKGDRRDAWQVYANGGVAALLALWGSSDIALRTWLVTASLAAAASDTWATAVGARSPVPPRLLWSRKRVSPGSSGGVTPAGNAGALAGAAIVAGMGALTSGEVWLLPAGTLIGFLGMLVDSLLGGTLQGKFWCPRCQRTSEWRTHLCGTTTERKKGWAWLNNDAVNLLATALAGGLAWAVWHWID